MNRRVGRMNRVKGDIVFEVIVYGLLILLAVSCLYPFWYELVLSFSTPESANQLGLRLFPMEFSVMAYGEVFQKDIIYIGYANTLFRTVLGTFLTVFVTLCGAYALSKRRLPFRGFITLFIVFTMFFSGGLIPNYFLIRRLGLLNSRFSLIFPVVTSAWYLIIARNFLMTLPESLEEAALIDGAHPLTIALRIILPLSKPMVAVLALWCAVGHWNAWFDALIYISSRNKMVLQLVLRRILIEKQLSDELMGNILAQQTVTTTPETVKAAVVIVSIAPIIILYPFLQKYFVKGIMVGALKG